MFGAWYVTSYQQNIFFSGGLAVTAFPGFGAFLLLPVSFSSLCPYFSWWLYILDCRMGHITLLDYGTMAIGL